MKTLKQIAAACVPLLVLWFAPVDGALAQVKVTAATPSSAYQGTTSLEVVVTGSGFDASAKVQYFVSGTTNPGGITVRSVAYRKSSELVTTIDVADGALLASYDIQVTLDTGRKGKGTTLFSVRQKPGDTPPPTYPEERAWHSFTSNGGVTTSTSRLYMYGGHNSAWITVRPDLWYYRAVIDSWTLVTPASTSNPGPRAHNGLSCGAGACLMAFGSNNVSLVAEPWVYSESANTWTPVVCRRTAPCPSARQMVTMAFDPDHGYHLLFGGFYSMLGNYNDTYTFDVATLKWTLRSPGVKPSERNRAAARHVPGVGVVMHGGQDLRGVLCDMYAWDGANWNPIRFDTSQPHPCLHSHDFAWDGSGLVAVGGYTDTNDTQSATNWRFTFAPDGRSGTWSTVSAGTCVAVLGTDSVRYPGARMAYDASTGTRVHFGGEVNTDAGVVRFDNTVECY